MGCKVGTFISPELYSNIALFHFIHLQSPPASSKNVSLPPCLVQLVDLIKMPSATEPEFETLHIAKLHPTFGAEIFGVDFSQPIPDSTFQQIREASDKVWELEI